MNCISNKNKYFVSLQLWTNHAKTKNFWLWIVHLQWKILTYQQNFFWFFFEQWHLLKYRQKISQFVFITTIILIVDLIHWKYDKIYTHFFIDYVFVCEFRFHVFFEYMFFDIFFLILNFFLFHVSFSRFFEFDVIEIWIETYIIQFIFIKIQTKRSKKWLIDWNKIEYCNAQYINA